MNVTKLFKRVAARVCSEIASDKFFETPDKVIGNINNYM